MATDHSILSEQWDSYIYARDNGHLRFVNKAEICENFFAGEYARERGHWDPAVKRRLTRLKRPAMTLNNVFPNMASMFGEQINNRADIAFRPSASGDPDTAAIQDKIHLHIANTQNLDFTESRVFEDGAITSRGFYDVRIDFTNNIRGEIVIKLDNPLNVMIDPDAEEYDPKHWKEVTSTKWLSLDDTRRIYGKDVHAALKGKTRSDSGFGYDFIDERADSFGGKAAFRLSDDAKASRRRLRTIERQHKKRKMVDHFVDTRTGDLRAIPDHWDHNKVAFLLRNMNDVSVIKKMAEEVWWTTTIDDVVAHNEKSIYRSFTKIPYFPFFRRGTTIGLVENQIGPQEMYNKTMSQELHIVNSTANGGWKLKRGSLKNMSPEELEDRGAETGLILELDDPSDAEKIGPNQVPTGLDRLSFLLKEDQKSTSMISDSQRGFDRADVAAKAIMAKKAAGSGSFGTPLSNLQETRRLLANKEQELWADFYTEERTFLVTGRGIQPKTEEITINTLSPEGTIIHDVTQGEYTAVVQPVPARNDFEQTQFQEAAQMRELGVQLPDHVLIEHSKLNRKHEIAEEVKQRTGFADPSETQQQIQQLELEMKQLEAQKADAEKKKIESEAALNVVKAEAESGKNDDSPANAQAEAEMERLELERQRIAVDARLQKMKTDAELAIKRQEMLGRLAIEREKLRMQQRQQEQRIANEKKAAENNPPKSESETPTTEEQEPT